MKATETYLKTSFMKALYGSDENCILEKQKYYLMRLYVIQISVFGEELRQCQPWCGGLKIGGFVAPFLHHWSGHLKFTNIFSNHR